MEILYFFLPVNALSFISIQVDIAAARRPASGRSLCKEPQVGGALERQVGGAYAARLDFILV